MIKRDKKGKIIDADIASINEAYDEWCDQQLVHEGVEPGFSKARFPLTSTGKYTVKTERGFRKRMIRSGTRLRLDDCYKGRREPLLWRFVADDSHEPGEVVELDDSMARKVLAEFGRFIDDLTRHRHDRAEPKHQPVNMDEDSDTITEKDVKKYGDDSLFGTWLTCTFQGQEA
jgi:hypothetical protein